MVDFDSLPEDKPVAQAQPAIAQAQPAIAQAQPAIAQAQPAIAQAQPPSFDEMQSDEDKYSTPLEMAKTAAEGVGKGLAGPIFTGAETAALGNDKEQLARQEANPIVHGAGEMVGLVGGTLALPQATLGGALAKAGSLGRIAGEAAGLGKIGSAVVGSAIENMVYQGSDEVSKMILKDPEQTANTAVTSMGLAGLIGGGFGAISPLWHATMGKKTGGVLGAVVDKLGGMDGAPVSPAEDALAKSGMDISPELHGLVSENPAVQEMARTLMQTDTNASGQAIQKSYKEMTNQAGDSMLEALGKTPEEVKSLPEVSKAEAGANIGKTLAKEYEAQINPYAQGFDELKSKLKNVDLLPATQESIGTVGGIMDNIAKRAIEEGWTAMPSSDIMGAINTVNKELPLQKNLKNLSDYITQVGNATNKDPMNGPLRRAGGIITSIMKDAEAEVMANKLGETEGPAAIEHFKALREGYAVQSALKEGIADRLGARHGSTSGYADTIRELARTDAEGVLRKLSGTGDANWLDFVKTHYPETAQVLKDYHTNALLEKAASKAEGNAAVHNSTLLKAIDKMPKELRNFVLSPEAQGSISAIGKALDAFKNPNHNFSNTGRTIGSLLKDVAPTALGAATALHTGGLGAGAMIGLVTKALGNEAPDAVRLAILRFLGSNQPIQAGAFKSMVDYIGHTIKGETLLSKASKSVFRAGSEVIPSHMLPKERDREKIKSAINDMQANPKDALQMAGNTGYYLPAHAQALSQTGSNAMQYLNSIKPNTGRAAPLDTPRQPNAAEKAQYNRALDIAQQPLLALKHLSDGTITPGDVAIIKTLYPGFYARSVQKLNDDMTKALANGSKIPYNTRLGLGLYLGQAMDSTMHPESIVAAQPRPAQAQPQTATQPASNPKRSTTGLNKMPKMYKTQAQSAEEDRMNRK